MAWNEPGGNGDKDPWGKSGGNRGNQGPPDLDEVLRNLQNKFGRLFGGGKRGGGSTTSSSGGGIGLTLVLVVLAVLWAATGFYKIEEAERGIVLRFGEHVDTTQKGLRWHLPIPIEKVEKIDVAKIYTIPLRATMLTQDENIVDVEGTVQFQIVDPVKYAFNVRNPEISLSQATESAVRESIGRSKMDYVITEGRGQIAEEVKVLVQEIVDQYATGLKIFKVNIQNAKPPEAVKDAFDDVTQAREDEERFKNEAQAYRNEVLPKARGAAARLREQADGFKKEVVAKSEGEASRFSKLRVEYQKAPKITRDRLYLDMMESVLNNSSKVMVDVEGGNNLLYLPLDKLMERSSNTDASLQSIEQQREQLRRVANQLNARTSQNTRARESR